VDKTILEKIRKEWGLPSKVSKDYLTYFSSEVRPKVRARYLSHLVTAIEHMVNEKRKMKAIENLKKKPANVDALNRQKNALETGTFRAYSIKIQRTSSGSIAKTYYHPAGALIYYNGTYIKDAGGEKKIRIGIAHQLGNIINKEIFPVTGTFDTKQLANLFAFIALNDRDKFYKTECKQFTSRNDIEILNDIIHTSSLNYDRNTFTIKGQ